MKTATQRFDQLQARAYKYRWTIQKFTRLTRALLARLYDGRFSS